MFRKVLALALTAVMGGLTLTGCQSIDSPGDAAADPALTEYVEPGQYAVGVRALYFHDPDRPFDAWNARHASPGYQSLLAEINAAGERQIVPTFIWYPVDAADTTGPAFYDDLAASPHPALSGAFQSSFFFYLGNLTDGAAAGPALFADPAAAGPVVAAVKEQLVNALYAAPIADGPFPVVIAAHGLGVHSLAWVSFAEYFASHGYIVIAPSFVSDSGLTNALDSPDSRYAAAAGPAAVDRAYQIILGEPKVISGFYKYFFGLTEPPGFGGPPEGGSLTAQPEGGEKVGDMMAEFFDQRVGDVSTIIDGLYTLNQEADACAAAYAAQGQDRHGGQVCGLFAGAIDLDNIGIAGHSLGSMTAQFTVARDPRAKAAVGYNNGPPRYWEPPGIFGSGQAADGQPAGNPGPVMQIHGSEDAFVQNVFRGLMWNQLSAAGGNPEDIWTLEPERALPTDENPQPIARNAYTRATGDKVIISVKDVNHGSLVDDHLALFPRSAPLTANGKEYWNEPQPAPRKAVGPEVLNPAFQGQPFTPLNWETVEGAPLYLPIFVRNYYTRNWFDFYLKGDAAAGRRFTENPIPDQNILDLRYNLPGR